jgi:hypothetical protein
MMQAVCLPRWHLSAGDAAYYGYRWHVCMGPWLVMFGKVP